ncbi:MAG TPA: hypothetical protein VH081_03175 [Solirubrobacteraceae bacterium]|nr:hypothetical protein [Solirubrobacteraceae bacterium]
MIVAVLAPVAAQAAEAPAIESLVAVNCKVEKCAQTEINAGEPFGPEFGPQVYIEPKAPTAKQAEEEGFLQAGGRVPFGITDFKLATTGTLPTEVPTSVAEHLRTDVAPGLATNPFAVAQCSEADFAGEPGTFAGEKFPGTGFFLKPTCNETPGEAGTIVGKQHATVYLAEPGIDLALEGTVYNLDPEEGLASEYGVALKLPKPVTAGGLKAFFKAITEKGITPPDEATQKFLEEQQYYAHTLIKGNVEWGQQAKGTGAGDYHDYFEIDVSPALPLISSRLSFEGTKGTGDFVTNATSCPGHNTTALKLTDKEGTTVRTDYTTPVGLKGCHGETDEFGETFARLPFEPSFSLSQGSTGSDQPDELTTSVSLPNDPTANSQSQVNTASIKLPAGFTLNPSAAAGLSACTVAQARIHSETFGVACPASSEIGTVSLDVPTLPDGSLTGSMYLGGPVTGSETDPISGPPYIVYVVANSTRYGVSVRLKGEAIPDEATGQLTTVFKENPEQPFTDLTLHFTRGALTAIANPLVCGSPTGSTSFTPVTGEPASADAAFGSSVTGCASTIPFSLTQSTSNQTTTAGGNTSFTFSLTRPEGHQYVSQVKTTLPAGLVGQIPKATQCTEAQASSNTCPATSQIGVASAVSGSGPTPYTFGGGAVYLTGPYQGAPFGLSIVVPAAAGPFNLGPVTTRAKLDIDPYTARVTTTATLPTIVKGIPIRLRGVTVSINKQGFLLNPTSCAALSTETSAVSTFGATQTLANSPFQLSNCSALKFKPTFKAKTSARTSKANGAELETTINEVPGQSNIKSVKVQLPKQLPSRLTTLQKACPAATFEANPYHCPPGSFVGGARANTPTLPGKLQGPAILVSHASAAFPDLDLVMEANGVRSILVGNTDIKKGITTTTFASPPDVPVSSITVNLPLGSHSALAANGNLCANPLVMPTTITAQSGAAPIVQNTKIRVAECGVRIVGHKVVGNTAYITVQTFAAGRISGKGASLATRFRKLSSAHKKVTIKVPLSRGGSGKRKPFKVKLRVGFVPKAKGGKASVAFVTVKF